MSALERQYAAAQSRLERCQADLTERDKELTAAVAKWVGRGGRGGRWRQVAAHRGGREG